MGKVNNNYLDNKNLSTKLSKNNETTICIMRNVSTPNSVVHVTFSNRATYCVDLQITKINLVSLFDTWNCDDCVFPTGWTLHTTYEQTSM